MNPSPDTLASFVPSLLLDDAREGEFSVPGSVRFPAVVLFADVAGFTALTERLAEGGPSGVEDLTRYLNAYFGRLIETIANEGGDTVKFAGDAVLALWRATDPRELPELGRRVSRCALDLQGELHDHEVAEGVRLSVKLAIGCGEVVAQRLGGVFDRSVLLLAGDPFSQVGRANDASQAGDVAASDELWQLIAEDAQGETLEAGVTRVVGVSSAPEAPPRTPAPVSDRALVAVRPFVPVAIRSALDAGLSEWIGELRRVTILFVNLSDFDPQLPLERAHEAVTALQNALYRYEGSINKISVDDKGASLIGVLGLPPLAHVDDPERGVRAALAMHRALTDLGLRSSIGVTTGRVFCGAIGSQRRREYTIMGDPVNVAARLMVAADGGILVDGPTAQASESRVEFEALPPLALKGKKEPFPVFRPGVEMLEPSAPAVMEAEIVGRQTERSTLLGALEPPNRGERPPCWIVGEPGIGKSRLLELLATEARSRGCPVLEGTGDFVGAATPYFPWRTIAAALVDLASAGPDHDGHRQHVLERVPADLRPVAPLLNAVLPLEWEENEHTVALQGKERADRTIDLILSLFPTDAGGGVLCLDNAHWLDSASWAVLGALSARCPEWLIALGSRPIETHTPELDALLARSGSERLELGPLSREDLIAIVTRRLGADRISDELANLIQDQAEGNPLFAEELASSLEESSLVSVNAGEGRLSDAEGLTDLPGTVEGVITRRIDRLAPSVQLTAKVASVIGRQFGCRTLAGIYPVAIDTSALLADCSSLDRRGLAPIVDGEDATLALDRTQRFKSAVTQEVAYNLMLFSQRRALHRATAEWIEEHHAENLKPHFTVLAHHWTLAAESNPAEPELVLRAAQALQRAGDRAIFNSANPEGISFYRRGLTQIRRLPESPERLERELPLLLSIGAPLLATVGYAHPEVEEVYERARTICENVGDDNLLFVALRGLWAYHVGRGEYAAAITISERLLELSHRGDDAPLRMEAHRSHGNASFWVGRLEESRASMEQGIELYQLTRDRSLALLYSQDPDVANRGMQAWPLSLLGRVDEALERGRQSLEHARRLEHPYTLGYALVHDMCCQQFLDEVEATEARANETIALASEKSFPNWLLVGMALKGWAQAAQGSLDEGLALIEQAIQLWRGAGSGLAVPYLLVLQAESLYRAGRHEEALAVLDDAEATALRQDEQWYRAEGYRVRALALWDHSQDRTGAQRALDTAQELAQAHGARLLELRAASTRLRLATQWGDDRAAREGLATVLGTLGDGADAAVVRQARELL